MDKTSLDDYLFLWRIVVSILTVLGLPWVINISKNVAILVAEVHSLRSSVNTNKMLNSKKLEALDKRLRAIESRGPK